MEKMQTVGDVRQLLKQMGTVIYTGDVEADRDLMEAELDDMREMGLLDQERWLLARRVLRQSAKG
ncbi:YqgQ family protein [Marininema halotolerans]|uniref:Uncharacterized protein YqgQ n=1 Tax=Marininema halotolerans TaxID=1155944 RepID=A0A1I6PY33_9BACL|nr:YqgQ family protein [Marininema halotolerans]SFS45131.1 Uncharacterized protein YqgQ [Marininema halotolerans]